MFLTNILLLCTLFSIHSKILALLSEVKLEKDKYQILSLKYGIQDMIQMNLFKKQTHKHRK